MSMVPPVRACQMPTKDTLIHTWRVYFDDIGLDADVKDAHLRYISVLTKRNVPVIFEIEHLSLLLGLRSGAIYAMLNSPEHFYRVFYIPKKLGGKREISTPLPSLLEAQRWINRNILSNLMIDDAAHAFAPRRSIITNARMHLAGNRLLKIDIKDFFGSIGIGRIISIFRSVGYNENMARDLALLCTKDKILPQGAATSPQLSNLSCNRLDKRLSAAAFCRGLTYTRYADDLTFSGDELDPSFLRLVCRIIGDEGFVVNDSKTRFVGPNDKKIVTGLIVDSSRIRPSAQFRRNVWQEIHFAHKFGLMSHLSKKKIAAPLYLEKLRGKLAFWRSVDSKDPRLIRAEKRLAQIAGK